MTVPLNWPPLTVPFSCLNTLCTTAMGFSSSLWIDEESDSLGPFRSDSFVPRATKTGRKYGMPPCASAARNQYLVIALEGVSARSRLVMTGYPPMTSPVKFVSAQAYSPRSSSRTVVENGKYIVKPCQNIRRQAELFEDHVHFIDRL
jgi:hypothetical protein